MSGILFVSSHNTGHGHKSITEALCEQLARLDPAVRVDVVDGFALGGRFSAAMSRMYNKIVVKIPLFWKFYYELGNIFPAVANSFTSKSLEKAFTKLIEDSRPDLIVSVHPCYVTSVEDILEKMGYNIPVISLVADLDNVARLWADRRSIYTLCPTENARASMVKYGVPEKRTGVFGFPVRDRFNHDVPERGISYYERISRKEKLSFLIMNGSQGRGKVTKMARELLDHFPCRVVILAGNNERVKNAAQKALQSYGDRVEVCGFTRNVEQYMRESDILILRASPNVLMEAINLCKPVIVTGALTGQEEKNPEFVRSNRLGIVCEEIKGLSSAVRDLLADSGRKLDEIYDSQLEYRKPEAAKDISEFLLQVMRESLRGGSNETD